ncbi:hypothetical protein EV182_005977, partial [Spiromyces aspiralis]
MTTPGLPDRSASGDLLDKGVNKHELYEQAVQTPKREVRNLDSIYRQLMQRYMRDRSEGDRSYALGLREDFCGTAALCAEWVKRDQRRWGVGVDIDEEVIRYGREVTLPRRNLCDGDGRISLVVADVMNVHGRIQPRIGGEVNDDDGSDNEEGAWAEPLDSAEYAIPKADIIAAFNYSVCYFHQRAQLIRYLRNSLDNLNDRFGLLACDLFGGSQVFVDEHADIRDFGSFKYKFEHRGFDLLTNTAKFAISFRASNGVQLKDAYTYHFRMYTPFELKEAMLEAGFDYVSIWISLESKDSDGSDSSAEGGNDSGGEGEDGADLSIEYSRRKRLGKSRARNRKNSQRGSRSRCQGSSEDDAPSHRRKPTPEDTFEGFYEVREPMPLPEIFN